MKGWLKRATSALVLLVGIALSARLIYGLLLPLLPLLICALVLIGIYAVVFGFWRH